MKKNKQIVHDDSSAFDKILVEIPLEDKFLAEMSLNAANRIAEILHEQNLKQKDLAEKLGKNEAEVSKWIGGLHNFTFRTIAKIQSALGQPIVFFPNEVKEMGISIYGAHFNEAKINYVKLSETGSISINSTVINIAGNVNAGSFAKGIISHQAKVIWMQPDAIDNEKQPIDELQSTGS